MKINPLRLFITPLMTVVFYIVANYISLVILLNSVEPMLLEMLRATLSTGAIILVTLLESLPMFLISLLFTMQYSMTSVNVKNIGYAFTTVLTMAVIKIILVVLCIMVIDYFGRGYEYRILRDLGAFPLYCLFIVLLFTMVGLVSHYYFVWTKQTVNPVELNATALITSISYVLLVFFPPIISGVSFAMAAYGNSLYGYSSYGRASRDMTAMWVAYGILFIYLFILVLFWVYDIVSKRFSANTYATNAIKGYVFTHISYVILYIMLIVAIYFIASSFEPRYFFRNINPEVLITVMAIITLVLLTILARLVKSGWYKVYYIGTSVFLVGTFYAIQTYSGFHSDILIAILISLFVISLSLCFLALCLRSSLKIAFR